ncbi:MAG: hypothetical protein WEC59_00925 [Salibacteraceae bacterium]
MTKFIIPITLIALTFGFSSCKKCYDCTTVQTVVYDDDDYNDFFGTEQSYDVEVCGRKGEIEDYENENTASATNSSFFYGSYTSSAVTTCVKQ